MCETCLDVIVEGLNEVELCFLLQKIVSLPMVPVLDIQHHSLCLTRSVDELLGGSQGAYGSLKTWKVLEKQSQNPGLENLENHSRSLKVLENQVISWAVFLKKIVILNISHVFTVGHKFGYKFMRIDR